jgi:sugar O-acyltransferase (sialic acid O-acetyltransferase NeuD family)
MKNIVIFGTSGHAKVVFDILEKQKIFKVVGFISSNEKINSYLGLPHFHQNSLHELDFDSGVVAIGDNATREFLVNFIKNIKPNFKFINAIHPSAQLAHDLTLGEGLVIMAGGVVNSGSVIGDHVIINTKASVDHDCKLESFVSLAPNVTLGGFVEIKKMSAIGLGANIIHNIKIEEEVVVGAGSLVLQAIEKNSVVYGNPSKAIRKRSHGDKYL